MAKNECGFWQRLRNAFPKHKPGVIEYIAVILCLCVLFSAASYSWIRRKWSPTLAQDNIEIFAGDALTFSLIGQNVDDDQAEQYIMLNQVLGLENFVLKPVSNLTGKNEDFFALNTAELAHEYFHHLSPGLDTSAEGYAEMAKQNGYIQLSFVVQGRDINETMQDYTKWVYLTHDTKIELSDNVTEDAQREAYKAIRVSLTAGTGNEAVTYVFVPEVEDRYGNTLLREHWAINNTKYTDGVGNTVYAADNTPYRTDQNDPDGVYDDDNSCWRRLVTLGGEDLRLRNTEVGRFSDYDGKTNGADDPERALFSINPGEKKTVTVRIWLEGEDPACIRGIMGSQINFQMAFESFNRDNTGGGGEVTEEETLGPRPRG